MLKACHCSCGGFWGDVSPPSPNGRALVRVLRAKPSEAGQYLGLVKHLFWLKIIPLLVIRKCYKPRIHTYTLTDFDHRSQYTFFRSSFTSFNPSGLEQWVIMIVFVKGRRYTLRVETFAKSKLLRGKKTQFKACKKFKKFR